MDEELRNFSRACQTLLELAESHGFISGERFGRCLLGAPEVQLGSPEKDLPLIEQGLHAYQNLTSPLVLLPMLLHLCARAYGAASQPETGLRMLNEALEIGSSESYKPLTSEFLILMGACSWRSRLTTQMKQRLCMNTL